MHFHSVQYLNERAMAALPILTVEQRSCFPCLAGQIALSSVIPFACDFSQSLLTQTGAEQRRYTAKTVPTEAGAATVSTAQGLTTHVCFLNSHTCKISFLFSPMVYVFRSLPSDLYLRRQNKLRHLPLRPKRNKNDCIVCPCPFNHPPGP